MRKINKIIIDSSEEDFGNLSRLIHKHTSPVDMGGLGYRTVGYHYVINNGKAYRTDEPDSNILDGQIEIGRPKQMAGCYCKGHNIDSIGICLIGKTRFTLKQLESLSETIDKLLAENDLTYDDVYSVSSLSGSKKAYGSYIDKILKEKINYKIGA